MRHITLVAVALGVLSIVLAPALVKAEDRQPATTEPAIAAVDQGVVVPVYRWGPRAFYGGYGWYGGPRYYSDSPGPVYRYGYRPWRSYYGPGAFYYDGPRVSFYFSY